MDINIRVMTPEDKPSIMQILRSTPEFKPSEVVIAEELIDSYLGAHGRSGYHFLVAEIDTTVAGYICFGSTPLTEGTWDIYWIAVAQDRQRRRIGSVLLESAEKNIREAGGRLSIVETSSTPAYANTRNFYHRNGYEIIAHLLDFYALGDDKLILQKRLR